MFRLLTPQSIIPLVVCVITVYSKYFEQSVFSLAQSIKLICIRSFWNHLRATVLSQVLSGELTTESSECWVDQKTIQKQTEDGIIQNFLVQVLRGPAGIILPGMWSVLCGFKCFRDTWMGLTKRPVITIGISARSAEDSPKIVLLKRIFCR